MIKSSSCNNRLYLIGPVIFCREWGYHTEARIVVPRERRRDDDDTIYPSMVVLGLGRGALSSLPLFALGDDAGDYGTGWSTGAWCSIAVPPSAGTLATGSAGSGRALWLETRALPASARRGDTRPARCVLGLDAAGARRGFPRAIWNGGHRRPARAGPPTSCACTSVRCMRGRAGWVRSCAASTGLLRSRWTILRGA
jgi:hypothetical protein